MELMAVDSVRPCSFLQVCEVVKPDEKHDLEIFGQCYRLPKSGVSPLVSGSTEYKYDFGSKEIILISDEGNEVYRKKVEPKSFAKSEYRWLDLTKSEARLKLGLDQTW